MSHSLFPWEWSLVAIVQTGIEGNVDRVVEEELRGHGIEPYTEGIMKSRIVCVEASLANRARAVIRASPRLSGETYYLIEDGARVRVGPPRISTASSAK